MTVTIEIGEGFEGVGTDVAHVNTVLGHRDGPVGAAFATALAQPSIGHVPFLCVFAPGVPVEPATLFVNKAAIAGAGHGKLTWGAAQAGVAEGVTAYAAERFDPSDLGKWALIVAVWVDPEARHEESVFVNNSLATLTALRHGRAVVEGRETGRGIASWRAGDAPTNPYFRVD